MIGERDITDKVHRLILEPAQRKHFAIPLLRGSIHLLN